MTQLICPSILTLLPSIDVLSAVDRIHQAQTRVALVANPHLVGIFTERNLFDAIAAGKELATLTLADVMTQSPIVLHESEAESLTVVLQRFQCHQLQYLPVVNDQEQPVGIITYQAVLEAWHRVEPQSTILQQRETRQPQLEVVLQQSETPFETLIDNIPGAIYRCCPSTWQDLFVSDGIETIVGYPGADFLINGTQRFTDLIHPEDLSRVQQDVNQALQLRQPFAMEYRVIHADGTVRWVDERGQGVFDEQGELLWLDGVIMDITDRKQTEAALQHSELANRLLLDANPNLLIRLTRDGTYRGFMPAKGFKSFTPDPNMQGKNIFEVMPSTFAQERMRYVELALQTGATQVYKFELEVDGDRRHQEAQISVSGADEVLIIVRDITERKRAEDTLRQREQEFRALAENAPDVITRVDREFRFRYVNPQLERETGIPVSEWLGKTELDLGYPESVVLPWHAVLQQVFESGQEYTYEPEFPTVAGTKFWSCRLVPEFTADGSVETVLLTSRDITDRKQMELALRESEEKFRQLAAHLQDVFWILSPKEAALLYVSPAFEKIWGRSSEAVYYNPYAFIDSIYPDDRERVINAILERNQSGEETDLEYRIIRADGEVRWIHHRGFPILNESSEVYRVVGIASDITDRKLSEESLRESEARLRALIENLPFGCWVCDTEGRHVLQNSVDIQRWGNLLGMTKDQLDLPQEMREHWKVQYQRVLAGEIVQGESKYPIDGELRTFFYILAPVRSSDTPSQNISHGIVGVSIDITDRKQTEEALQQAKEAAESANHAKSEFLSRMSHELRTPLTSVLGFAALIARDPSLPAEHQEHLAIIRRSGTHLLNLINSVLEMSRIEAGELTLNETSFNLLHLLETIRDLFQLRVVSKGLTLSVTGETDLPQYIQADENKLRQVLINLLDNAIKFTETGRVTLRVNRAQQPASELAPHLSGSSAIVLRFQVEDTGVGIAPEEMDILFNAFAQTESGRRLQQGTGLGLTISRQFIQMMGGEIAVSSQLGRGTVLLFEIPVRAAETTAASSAAFMPQQVIGLATSTLYRILIVDDQIETRKLLVKLLKPIGFEIEEATNGQEAVALWERWNPHLIWMDMGMPVMDGYTATREIRIREKAGRNAAEPSPSTKIIALTANAFDQQRTDALAAGCNDFVAKPFQQANILEKIAEHLALQYSHAVDRTETFHLTVSSLQRSYLLTIPSALPAGWSTDLRNAALRLNSNQCLKLIEQLHETDKLLAQRLTDWVNRFQFDAIVDWVKQFGD